MSQDLERTTWLYLAHYQHQSGNGKIHVGPLYDAAILTQALQMETEPNHEKPSEC